MWKKVFKVFYDTNLLSQISVKLKIKFWTFWWLLKMTSSIHQNMKIAFKELIHAFLTGWIQTFNSIIFSKESYFAVTFFLRILPHMINIANTFATFNCHAVAFIPQSKQLVCATAGVEITALMAYILSSCYRFKTFVFYN